MILTAPMTRVCAHVEGRDEHGNSCRLLGAGRTHQTKFTECLTQSQAHGGDSVPTPKPWRYHGFSSRPPQ